MTATREEAAQAREKATRTAGDRPRERRCAEKPHPLAQARAVTRHPMEVRAADGDGSGLDFSGYASVTEAGYEMYDFFGPYTEIVSRGAFDKSLSQDDLDVPLVLGHDSMRRIARTTNGSLTLSADDIGLLAQAPNLDPNDADVAYIAPKVKSGLIDEMSFRFSITAGQWSPDYTEYRIDGADIHRGDVSIVGYGANPATSAELRAAMEAIEHAGDPADLETLLRGLDADAIREAEQAFRRELKSRGLGPSMSLHDLLKVV